MLWFFEEFLDQINAISEKMEFLDGSADQWLRREDGA